MYLKIYFDDKPLFLCDDIDETIQPLIHHDDSVFIDELNTHALKTMIHEMQQPQVHAGIYIHSDLEELKKAFIKKFTLVRAAGGLVMNEKSEILMIFRKWKWDLPKGKFDKGEKPGECALRETEEETGLKNVMLLDPLITTYHTYHEGSRFMLKETDWFNMKADSEQRLIPQKEEDIHDIKWVSRNELKEFLQNSYPSVADVIQASPVKV